MQPSRQPWSLNQKAVGLWSSEISAWGPITPVHKGEGEARVTPEMRSSTDEVSKNLTVAVTASSWDLNKFIDIALVGISDGVLTTSTFLRLATLLSWYLMKITALIPRNNCDPVKSLAEVYENKLNFLWVLKQEEYFCSVEISSDQVNFTLTVKIKC